LACPFFACEVRVVSSAATAKNDGDLAMEERSFNPG
jgi:hypothetical protein